MGPSRRGACPQRRRKPLHGVLSSTAAEAHHCHVCRHTWAAARSCLPGARGSHRWHFAEKSGREPVPVRCPAAVLRLRVALSLAGTGSLASVHADSLGAHGTRGLLALSGCSVHTGGPWPALGPDAVGKGTVLSSQSLEAASLSERVSLGRRSCIVSRHWRPQHLRGAGAPWPGGTAVLACGSPFHSTSVPLCPEYAGGILRPEYAGGALAAPA